MRTILRNIKRLLFNRVFSRVLLGYLALTLIIATLCGVSYNLALKMSRQAAIDRNTLLFENASASINATYDLIDRFSGEIYSMPQMRRLIYANGDAKANTYLMYDAINALPDYMDGNRLLDKYYVYLSGLDAIVSPDQGFVNLKNYYSEYFMIDPTQSYEQWHAGVLSATRRALHGNWQTGSRILDAVPMNTPINKANSCIILYVINAENLLGQLSDALSNVSECAAISDLNGNILSISNKDQRAVDLLKGVTLPAGSGVLSVSGNGTKYILSYATVEKMGARLMVLIPQSALQAQANESIRGMVTALVWLLIAGLFMIVALIIGSFLPLLNAAEHAAGLEPGVSGMHAISDMVKHMESSNATLSKKLNEHHQNMRTVCINRLIHGSDGEPRPIEELTKTVNLPIRGSEFRSVLVEFLAGDAPLTPSPITDALATYDARLTFLQAEKTNVFACLFASNGEDADELHAFFAALYESIQTLYGVEAVFYVGSACESVERIPRSFSSARWLMTKSPRGQWLYIDLGDRPGIPMNEVLPSEEENRLVGAVMTGDAEETEKELNALYHRLCIENNVQGFTRQYLFCRLIGILAKCRTSSGEEAVPDHLLRLSPEEFFQWIRPRFTELCEEAQRKTAHRTGQIADDVRVYIEENYTDINLSLNLLAFRFGITANYLSGMFKKHFGMNFSSYVEKVRMEHAEALLMEGRLSVDEVAQKVGYTNSDSFRRAFKRSRGISPSQFKGQ